MKHTYTDPEDNLPKACEPIAADYNADNSHHYVVAPASSASVPCVFTDEEMHQMLEDVEEEQMFIPDALVRKMFV